MVIEPPAKKLAMGHVAEGLRLVDVECRQVTTAWLIEDGPLRRRAERTTLALAAAHGRLVASGRLSAAGRDLVGPPREIATSAAAPDLVLIAKAQPPEFRPRPRERGAREARATVRTRSYPALGQARGRRERTLPAWGIAVFVLGAVGAAAVAALAPYDFWR